MGSKQEVEIPEGCTIEPPRLGKIGEFSFELQNKLSFDLPRELEWEFDEDELDQLDTGEKGESVDPTLITAARIQKALKAAQRPLWAIFVVLVLILFNII